MPNIAQVLKEEITRLAKKEVKQGTAAMKRDTVWLKKAVADLKRRVVSLERENKLLRAEAKRGKGTEIPVVGELKKMRVTGEMIRRLRAKLKISQAALAAMLDVSGQSVYQWERKGGRLRLREQTKINLQRVRQLSRSEVVKEIESLKQTAKPKAKPKPKAKAKTKTRAKTKVKSKKKKKKKKK